MYGLFVFAVFLGAALVVVVGVTVVVAVVGVLESPGVTICPEDIVADNTGVAEAN